MRILRNSDWEGCDLFFLAGMQDNEKALRPKPEGLRWSPSERRIVRGRFRARCRRRSFSFRSAEPPHGVGADAPEDGDFRRLGLLGLAVLALILRANEHPVDEDVVALVKRIGDGLAEAVERDDAVPLGFRLPLVVRVLPRLLRGDRQHGEIHAVAADLPLFRVLAEEADELDVIDYVE